VLLVSYHVIGDAASRGLGVDDDSIYRMFSNIFIHLRMPLFTFLSGFVYAYRPVRYGAGLVFARKKLQRLLVPLFVVSTIYFAFQQLAPGTNTKQPWTDLWQIYLFPYNHFWFLQAIILIFAATALLERAGWLLHFDRYLAILGVALLLNLLARVEPNVFSINQACYLAPFFLAGLGANRFHDRLWHPWLRMSMLWIFVVTFALHVLGCTHVLGEPFAQRTFPATALSLCGIFTLMYWTPRVGWLGWLGAFSFTIYLYHVFFTAGTRIALHGLGLFDLPLNWLLGCAVGVVGPALLELAIRRSAIARRLLLGQS